MICPLCGKESVESTSKCDKCGYSFEINISDYTPEIRKDSLEPTREYENQSYKEEYQDNSYNSEKDKYHELKSDEVKDEISEIIEKHDLQMEKDKKELLIAILLGGIAVATLLCFMIDSHFNPFDLRLMAIIAVIGLIASLLCTSYEGEFPGTLAGTIVRALVLTIALDVPNVITIALLIITYIISIYYLIYIYNGRISGIILGTVGIICFPYLGIIVLVFMEMILGGYRKSNNKTHK